MERMIDVKKDLKTLAILTLGAAIYAFNLRSFVNTGGLFPGGFAGITLLIQRIGSQFFHVAIPYSLVYLPLNIVPAYIGFRFIGKRFTIFSFYVVFLSSFLTDLLPDITITYDTLLISIFGGILNGVSISVSLLAGASGGGTDFISIYFSEKKGIDTWNYIFLGNVCILTLAGILFGFDAALYSIIFQFCSTQVIQLLYKRYKKEPLFIISDKSNEIYHAISDLTHHDATLFKGVGCYEEKEKTLIYSVINSEAKRELIPMIRGIDEHAFINVVKTEELDGRFHDIPHD